MGTYRKNPVEVEAKQFTGENWSEIQRFCGFHMDSSEQHEIMTFNRIGTYMLFVDPEIVAEVWDKLHATWVGVKKDQWIIRGLKGEFYPCDPDVFKASYSEIEELPA